MSLPLVINGAVFDYPEDFDTEWGIDATGWAQAVTNGMLQKAGGSFPLTSTVDFGASFGMKVKSITTKATNPSTSGYLMLAHSDTIGWRNNANGGNVLLSVDGSDMLRFNGNVLGTTSLTHNDIYVGDVTNNPAAVPLSGDATIIDTGALTISNGAITNAKVNASAAIALSKLATMTASRVLVSDGSGLISPSSVTATTLSYLDATSSIQTQLNSKLSLSGGTMSGAISMASNKITALGPGTGTGDALAWGQALQGSALTLTGLLTGTTATFTSIAMSGPIFVADGSATAPSYSFTNNNNLGLYRSAANEISIATTGTQQVRISGAGRIFVGPGSYSSNQFEMLAVHASGNGSIANTSVDIIVQNDSTGTARFVALGGSGGSDPASYIAAAQAGQVGSFWSGGPVQANSCYHQFQNPSNTVFLGTNDAGPWWFRSESSTGTWHYVANTTEVANISAKGFIPATLTADPSSPTEGVIYYNTTSHHWFGWNGSAWKQLDN